MKKVKVLKGFIDGSKADEPEYTRGEVIELSDERAAELEAKEFVQIISDIKK